MCVVCRPPASEASRGDARGAVGGPCPPTSHAPVPPVPAPRAPAAGGHPRPCHCLGRLTVRTAGRCVFCSVRRGFTGAALGPPAPHPFPGARCRGPRRTACPSCGQRQLLASRLWLLPVCSRPRRHVCAGSPRGQRGRLCRPSPDEQAPRERLHLKCPRVLSRLGELGGKGPGKSTRPEAGTRAGAPRGSESATAPGPR